MKSRAAFIRISTFAAILAAALWAGVANAQTVTVAGAMPGKLSVGATGKASYDIPIAVPPGIAGMQPNLSLHYGSGAGNGIAGMGWSISGLSAIQRCPRTPAQDGQWGGIEYNANDRFCLGGKRLVAVNGVYGADGTEYRTEIDGFLKVVSYGQVVSDTGVPGTSPEWFRVWTKSGRIMDFGATGDSRVEVVRAVAPAAGEPIEIKRWAISRVADSAGNYLTLTYFEDLAIGAHRIDRIDYSFNDAAAVVAQSSVRFLYEARPDTTQGYPNGSLTTLDVRLRSIQTWTDGALVRDYGLAYETGAATGRSRLTSVTECDGMGNCFTPHSFGWKPQSTFVELPGVPAAGGIGKRGFVDVNGDGLKDIVRAFQFPTRVEQTTFLNTDNGFQESPAHRPPFYLMKRDSTWPGTRVMGEFADVNGDGLKDFVEAGNPQLQVLRTWISTGNGWEENPAYSPPFQINKYWEKKISCTEGECSYEYYSKPMGDFVDLSV